MHIWNLHPKCNLSTDYIVFFRILSTFSNTIVYFGVSMHLIELQLQSMFQFVFVCHSKSHTNSESYSNTTAVH